MELKRVRVLCKCNKEFERSIAHSYIISCPECRKLEKKEFKKNPELKRVAMEKKQAEAIIRKIKASYLISDGKNQFKITRECCHRVVSSMTAIDSKIFSTECKRCKTQFRKVGEYIGIGHAIFEWVKEKDCLVQVRSYYNESHIQ